MITIIADTGQQERNRMKVIFAVCFLSEHYRTKNRDSGKNKSEVELLFLLALTNNTKKHWAVLIPSNNHMKQKQNTTGIVIRIWLEPKLLASYNTLHSLKITNDWLKPCLLKNGPIVKSILEIQINLTAKM